LRRADPSVAVESNQLVAGAIGAADERFPAPKFPGGHDGVVRERLDNLFTFLGDLPFQRPITAPNWTTALGRLLDDMCPPEAVVLHGRRLPDRALSFDHLVVAPIGLVVVGPCPGHVGREAPSQLSVALPPKQTPARLGTASANGGGRRARRPGLVRETLRRRYALRFWLAGTGWAEVPVRAAVCAAAVLGPTAGPPLILDGLWLGPADRLPAWLASGSALGSETRAALARFLDAELPVRPAV